MTICLGSGITDTGPVSDASPYRIRTMMTETYPLLARHVEIREMYAGVPPRKQAKPSQEDGDHGNPVTAIADDESEGAIQSSRRSARC